MIDNDRLERWRLILGGGEAEGTGHQLAGVELGMDRALELLYDAGRSGGLGASAPGVVRWLDDVRSYFPRPVVQVLQADALERLHLERMLLEPELLAAVEPDLKLAATLIGLSSVLPQRTRETARLVVRKVVGELEARLRRPLESAVRGALHRASRTSRPRHAEIDWHRTLRANLRHYQPERRAMVVEKLVGFGRRRSSLRDVILCVDQSGSMAASVVYSGVLGCVLSSLPALRTSLIVFDTSVVDLTALLSDPIDVLFGTRLGGGTDITAALAYAQGLVRAPRDTVLILITDLFEGGSRDQLLSRAATLAASGVQLIVLLALSDDGAPAHDAALASAFAALGAPAFACTPDRFPALMAAALSREDLGAWASSSGIQTARPAP